LGTCCGLVLAGGEGRRMGGADKALLPLGGKPLLDHVLARLVPQVGLLAISANGAAGRFARWGLPVLADEQVMGPLAGVLAGLRWAAQTGGESLLTVAVDSPFFPDDLAARLGAGPAMAAWQGRLHPTFAVWPVTLAPLLAAELAKGHTRLRDFAALAGARVVDFGAEGEDPFRNLNTRADLAAAEGLL
jgi:molybdopterin-guanine dinucleotide biosynthesis protein A